MTVDGKVRVLHLGSPTGLYGAERWILALANNIDRASIDIEVSVILDDPGLNADLCKEAARIGVPASIFEAHGKFNWSAVRQVRAHLVKNKIDILHTHGYKTDIIGIFATRGTRCKIITTPHGWSADAGLNLRIYETIDRAAFIFFDRVVPLSEDLHKGLRWIPFVRNKLKLIPNGVDLSDIDRVDAVADEILEWKSKGYFVIGYIGQLIPRKGLDLLLKVLAEVGNKNCMLAIIGDGESRNELVQLAKDTDIGDRVRFFGFRSDRLSFLKGFDVFALPSLLEGVPRCLMEAMACYVPVIASDIPGCRDLVKHEETGLLFRSGSVDAFSRALTLLVSNSPLRGRLASNARKMIDEEWSAFSMAKRYAQLYSELAHG